MPGLIWEKRTQIPPLTSLSSSTCTLLIGPRHRHLFGTTSLSYSLHWFSKWPPPWDVPTELRPVLPTPTSLSTHSYPKKTLVPALKAKNKSFPPQLFCQYIILPTLFSLISRWWPLEMGDCGSSGISLSKGLYQETQPHLWRMAWI